MIPLPVDLDAADAVLTHDRQEQFAPKTPQSLRSLSHTPEAPERASQDRPVPSSGVGAVSGGSGRESDDDYRAVVAILNDRWRVIVCRDGVQWILQKRSGRSSWRGQTFCRTKSGLLLCVKERCAELYPAAAATLAALPARI